MATIVSMLTFLDSESYSILVDSSLTAIVHLSTLSMVFSYSTVPCLVTFQNLIKFHFTKEPVLLLWLNYKLCLLCQKDLIFVVPMLIMCDTMKTETSLPHFLNVDRRLVLTMEQSIVFNVVQLAIALVVQDEITKKMKKQHCEKYVVVQL